MVVLDEAQAIKNAETRRAQVIHRLQAGFRLALTGTPVENDLGELWSLFSFVNPGLLGSRERFQKRFAGPIERDRDAGGARGAAGAAAAVLAAAHESGGAERVAAAHRADHHGGDGTGGTRLLRGAAAAGAGRDRGAGRTTRPAQDPDPGRD